MTILTLNGTQVFPAGNQTIKLTRENPYFTQSESYTLDVTLPMDILENRQFFGSIHRLEHSKRLSTMTCLLTVNNKPVLSGTAKVTQVSELEVKVQLVGGRSEINLLSNENQVYIDEMDMGGPIATYVPEGRSGHWEYNEMPVRYIMQRVFNETDGRQSDAPQPNLNDVLTQVLQESGYVLVENDRSVSPWNSLYIASAKRTLYLSHALPHWTVKEFLEEYCRFFNCTLVIDQMAKSVKVRDNATFFGNARPTLIEPVDEYSVALDEDSVATSLASSNLNFDMSGSSEHDYDVIPDNVRESAPVNEYASRNEAITAYNEMNEAERPKYIYKTPVGLWTGWNHDHSDIGQSDPVALFTQIDVFGPLIRDSQSDSEISLKICPVAISEVETTNLTGGRSQWTFRMVCLENPTGDERDTRGRGSESDSSTIQEYIEGDADIEKSEKEDKLQVFFMDDVEQDSICVDITGASREGVSVGDIRKTLMPFTDYLYKKNHSGEMHRLWSLSLNPVEAEHYLGQLHQNSYSFNMKAKYCVKFLADEMPDPTQVFIIRNKRFACEKIEAQIDDQGLQQLMTGYFYEML